MSFFNFSRFFGGGSKPAEVPPAVNSGDLSSDVTSSGSVRALLSAPAPAPAPVEFEFTTDELRSSWSKLQTSGAGGQVRLCVTSLC